MNQKNMLFVFNPNAGKGEIRSKAIRIMQIFSMAGYNLSVYPTSCPGELPNIIESRGKNAERIVCCGGDGTLNETVTGLLKLEPRPPLGYLPAGTVNDFASGLGISKDLETAAKAVVNGSPFDVDIGQFEQRYFTYVAAFGAFTEVSYQTSQQSKNMLGRMAYFLEGLKSIPNLKSYRVHIKYDGGFVQGDYLFGMISNASSVGGMKLLDNTQISMNDGMFEVLLIQKPDSLTSLPHIINAILLHDYSSPSIISFRTHKITLFCEDEMPWTLDGEYGGISKKVEIENLHLALRVIK